MFQTQSRECESPETKGGSQCYRQYASVARANVVSQVGCLPLGATKVWVLEEAMKMYFFICFHHILCYFYDLVFPINIILIQWYNYTYYNGNIHSTFL